uniref:Uncharacterized protein n=1 Tax=Sphaerodactylus townsendi TaxID=933632 RepID=A0ACB8EDB3_9SAUR
MTHPNQVGQLAATQLGHGRVLDRLILPALDLGMLDFQNDARLCLKNLGLARELTRAGSSVRSLVKTWEVHRRPYLGHPDEAVNEPTMPTVMMSHCFFKNSKLTRESGTDFPIPPIPPVVDSETEKLIREKDAELRQMQEMLQKIQQQMTDSH